MTEDTRRRLAAMLVQAQADVRNEAENVVGMILAGGDPDLSIVQAWHAVKAAREVGGRALDVLALREAVLLP